MIQRRTTPKQVGMISKKRNKVLGIDIPHNHEITSLRCHQQPAQARRETI